MSVYLVLVVTGLVFGLVLTPVVTSASMAFGLLDAPGGRKVHSISVPRLGGLAINLAAICALATVLIGASSWTSGGIASLAPIVPILAGAALVFGIGLVDDLRALPAWPKVLVQILAAAIVMTSGLLIERVTIGGETFQLGLIAWPVTLAWIVGLTNAFNLIDGVDGLAVGVSIIAGTTCALILINRGHAAEAMLLSALVGASLGFLVYNFAPASIFLGDGGSLVFGFVLATTAITGWHKGATALDAGVPLLIFALPIADAVSALMRRAFRDSGRPPAVTQLLRQIAEPDREHIHHRLMALGWSPRRTVLLLYALTLLLSAVALATARLN